MSKISRLFFSIAVFFIPFVGFAPISYAGTGFQVTSIFTILSLFIVVLDYKNYQNLHFNKTAVILLLFLFLCFLSVYHCLIIQNSFKGQYPFFRWAKQTVQLAISVSFFILAQWYLKDISDLRKLNKIIVTSGFFVALIAVLGIINFYHPIYVFRNFMDVMHNSPSMGGGSLKAGGYSADSPQSSLHLPKVSATFSEGSLAASYFIFVIGNIFLRKELKETFPNFSLVVILFLGVIVFTFTRSAVLALLTFYILYLYGKRKMKLKHVLIILIFFLMLYKFSSFDSSFSISSYENISDLQSNWTRITNILTGINVFLSYPILGVGNGLWGFYYGSHLANIGMGNREVGWMLDNFNPLWPTTSLYVRILSEDGLIGFLLFVFFIYNIVKPKKQWKGKKEFNIYLILLSTSIAVLFTFVGEESFSLYYFWIVLAMLDRSKQIL